MKKKKSHIEKKRKIIKTSIFVILGLIASLSVAYAALSTTLTISGSGKVTATNWNILIKNSILYSNKKTGGASYTTPTINGTTISYTVTLTKPSDSITLYFDVQNQGDINGTISSIINSTPTCTSSTGNSADASLVCDNLDITISYASGASINKGDVINREHYTCYNGYVTGYYQTTIQVTVKLKDTMTSVPSSSVTLSNMKHDIIYSQTDKTCTTDVACFVAGTEVLTKDGYKKIEDLKVDDYIYTVNLETNQYELNKVLRTMENYTNEIYELTVDGHIIETTEKHQFYIIDKGWIRAAELEVGDQLSTALDKDTTITKIEIKKYEEKIPVYNLEAEKNHNYLITKDKYLVHNAVSSR